MTSIGAAAARPACPFRCPGDPRYTRGHAGRVDERRETGGGRQPVRPPSTCTTLPTVPRRRATRRRTPALPPRVLPSPAPAPRPAGLASRCCAVVGAGDRACRSAASRRSACWSRGSFTQIRGNPTDRARSRRPPSHRSRPSRLRLRRRSHRTRVVSSRRIGSRRPTHQPDSRSCHPAGLDPPHGAAGDPALRAGLAPVSTTPGIEGIGAGIEPSAEPGPGIAAIRDAGLRRRSPRCSADPSRRSPELTPASCRRSSPTRGAGCPFASSCTSWASGDRQRGRARAGGERTSLPGRRSCEALGGSLGAGQRLIGSTVVERWCSQLQRRRAAAAVTFDGGGSSPPSRIDVR